MGVVLVIRKNNYQVTFTCIGIIILNFFFWGGLVFVFISLLSHFFLNCPSLIALQWFKQNFKAKFKFYKNKDY